MLDFPGKFQFLVDAGSCFVGDSVCQDRSPSDKTLFRPIPGAMANCLVTNPEYGVKPGGFQDFPYHGIHMGQADAAFTKPLNSHHQNPQACGRYVFQLSAVQKYPCQGHPGFLKQLQKCRCAQGIDSACRSTVQQPIFYEVGNGQVFYFLKARLRIGTPMLRCAFSKSAECPVSFGSVHFSIDIAAAPRW